MPSIVLAEDHDIVRLGFRSLIQAQMGYSVVGETGDGAEAVALCERLHPDVAVFDLALPGLDGLEATRRVRETCPGTRVVILSMHGETSYVVRALRYGASSYVLKESTADELMDAIRAAMSGRRFLSSSLPQDLIQDHGDAGAVDPYETLTDREREVLQLVAEGYTSPEIADRLDISPRTADTYRARILAKLNLRGVPELVRFAVGRGLVSAGSPPDRDGA